MAQISEKKEGNKGLLTFVPGNPGNPGSPWGPMKPGSPLKEMGMQGIIHLTAHSSFPTVVLLPWLRTSVPAELKLLPIRWPSMKWVSLQRRFRKWWKCLCNNSVPHPSGVSCHLTHKDQLCLGGCGGAYKAPFLCPQPCEISSSWVKSGFPM